MAAVNVVLNGTFTTDAGSQVGSFQGTMAYSDRGVGGGPIVPPEGGPPSIWPSPGHPAHPIAPGGPPGYPAHPIAPGGEHPAHPIELPPVNPGEPPVSIWPGRPEHPIVLPPEPPPAQPPETVTVLKAPPPSGGWGAVSNYGWAYYPAQGEAQPKG